MRSGLTRPVGKRCRKTTFDQSDFRNIVPCFSSNARKTNLALTDLLGVIAKAKGMTPSQIAPAWLLAQKPCLEALPSVFRT
jgi:aryl-alcohol dehydrogenase-like predicted oxidoreductase